MPNTFHYLPNSKGLLVKGEAVIYDGKHYPTYMVCDVCGLICSNYSKPLPAYIRENTQAIPSSPPTVQMISLNHYETGGPQPQVGESAVIAIANVRATLKAMNVPPPLDFEVLIHALLFTSHRKDYFKEHLLEFEGACVHVFRFQTALIDKIYVSGKSHEHIASQLTGPVEAVMQKHQQIEQGLQGMNLEHRKKHVVDIVESLIHRDLTESRQPRAKEVLHTFLIPRLLKEQQYFRWSDELVACCLYSLSCTYAGFQMPSLEYTARKYDLMKNMLFSVTTLMGEDISNQERRS